MDVADATKKHTGAVRTLRTTYGLHTDPIWILITPWISKFDFSVASPQTLHIRGGCHKDITNGTNVFMDEKYHP